jgi:hypothetical protein
MNKSFQGTLFPIFISHTSPDEAIHVNLDLSVQYSSHRLSLAEDETIEMLVNARTWIHNTFFTDQAADFGVAARDEDSRGLRKAMIAFADQLDAMDDVLVRLDERVAARLPLPAPIVCAEHREQDLMIASVGMTAHEAAWVALRSTGTLDEERHTLLPAQALGGVQLDLPLWANRDDMVDAGGAPTVMRRQHRARHAQRHWPAPARQQVVAAGTGTVPQSEASLPAVPMRQGRVFRESRSAHLQ